MNLALKSALSVADLWHPGTTSTGRGQPL